MHSWDKRRKENGRVHGAPWNKGLHKEICMDCDGCGWVEGGKTLQTNCDKCKGRGHVYVPRYAAPVTT